MRREFQKTNKRRSTTSLPLSLYHEITNSNTANANENTNGIDARGRAKSLQKSRKEKRKIGKKNLIKKRTFDASLAGRSGGLRSHGPRTMPASKDIISQNHAHEKLERDGSAELALDLVAAAVPTRSMASKKPSNETPLAKLAKRNLKHHSDSNEKVSNQDGDAAMDPEEVYYLSKLKKQKNYMSLLEDDGLLDLLIAPSRVANGHSDDDSSSIDVDDYRSEIGSQSEDSDVDMEEVEVELSEEDDDEEEEHKSKIINNQDENGPDSDKENMTTANALEKPAYIPPHLRKKSPEPTNALLLKKVKGKMNRLSLANLSKISTELTALTAEYPRKLVTTAITTSIIDVIADRALLLDEFCAVHAGLVKCLSEGIGREFCAWFINVLMEKYITKWEEMDNDAVSAPEREIGSKECTNCILLLAYLYNFKVVSCRLVYDLIRLSLGRMKEIDVEILLKLLKACGSGIKADDASALGDIVKMMQEKTEQFKKDGKTTGTRFRFMVETILDLKNNKKKHSGAKSAAEQQNMHVTAIGKAIKATCGATRLEPLNVSLKDLRDQDKVGVWWLVGGSYKGNLIENKETSSAALVSHKDDHAQDQENTLHELTRMAQLHHMNTDTRKEIFTIVMGSQDFMQAKTKLTKLNLRGPVSRDIIRVILYCMAAEKTYNPYYVYLICMWCGDDRDRGERVTLLYTLWDFLKQAREKNREGVIVMARGVAEFVWRGVVGMGVLKPIMDAMVQAGGEGMHAHQELFVQEFMMALFTRKLGERREKGEVKSGFVQIWKACASSASTSSSIHANTNSKKANGSLDYEIGQWVLVYLKSVFKKRVFQIEADEEVRRGLLERIECVKRVMKGMDS